MMTFVWSIALLVYFLAGRKTQIVIAMGAFVAAHLLVTVLVHYQLRVLAATGQVRTEHAAGTYNDPFPLAL